VASSAAKTVEQYIELLPADRRAAITTLRDRLRRALPRGFEEVLQYGMISWVVPLAKYPDTYNGQPLAVLSLASQKQYISLYLLGLYGSPELRAWFEKAYAKSGKKLDMGKSCLRFRTLDELALDVVVEAVGKVGVDPMIAMAEAAHGKKARGTKKAVVSKTAAQKRPAAARSVKKSSAKKRAPTR
jgi:hypothetical protein